ncbi:hypothetical protein [Crocosphaera sp.]|uniref:hypothetical protein n=1 Tax=Crocosphaera sp. TaxID=2729996 RepID=UPI0026394ED4|nr:hypothetical protein [Crocosphaera sp.]MDJ0579394.1 hypothetical protein [Crocosphaera sp.]
MNITTQTDTSLITFFLNTRLDCISATVSEVSVKDNFLMIMIESIDIPDQEKSIKIIQENCFKLNLKSVERVKVYGKKQGNTLPDWDQELGLKLSTTQTTTSQNLIHTPSPKKHKNQNISATTTDYVEDSQKSWWHSITQTATSTSNAIGGAMTQAGGVIADNAMEIGKTVADTTVNAGSAMGKAALSIPGGVGYLYDVVSNNPQLQELTKGCKIDWLVAIIENVDVVKAETEVKQLKEKYPHETSSEIAHRIIVDKAIYSGGTGLMSSLVPGVAAAMFAVDLAATTLLQAEMVCQIACAYGLDLEDSARKGEILSIFGLALGGSQAAKLGGKYALKAGLGFLRNIPAAGAVIGASTNALIIYALGHSACQFYEAQFNPLEIEATLEQMQLEGTEYLQKAITQEVIMDQVLVHLFLAGNPQITQEKMLPELQTLNLSPASLESITQNLHNPPSLEHLLSQLNQDFAVALLAQCEKVAKLDGVITLEELAIIKIIANHFNLPINL